MITNLFSIFDPSSSYISLNWLRIFLGILFIPNLFWIIPSRYIFIFNLIIHKIHQELKILLNPKFKGRSIIFSSLFLIILFNNFLGLFPYIFTCTSHIIITLSLALPIWLLFIIYGWLLNTQHIFTHLVPQGTPWILISFIICIETIRNIIRPITLSIRLSANIIAGHLLITLLGNIGTYLIRYIFILLIITQLLLLLLECRVTIIQSYVFTILRTLYSNEINN